MSDPTIAGVDIGGTKTHIALDRAGRRIAERVLATDDWRVRRGDTDAQALARLVLDLVHDVGPGVQPPAATVIGAHGCDTAGQCRGFEARFAGLLPGRIHVVNDAELLLPAAGFGDGIGLVAGTGSIAVARLADDTMLVAGGWGWILGDEGSAPALVREAARTVRAAIDEGPPAEAARDPLTRALLETLGADDPAELGPALSASRGAASWGRHAHAVFTAAEAGSSLAAHVIAHAGQALAELVLRLRRRGAPMGPVVAGGGVIVNQPLLMASFRAATARLLPDAAVILLDRPPVDGALVLARRRLGGTP